MATRAKIFTNGRSQAVRLPKEYRFDDEEVIIHKIGDAVMLLPVNSDWNSFMEAVDMFSSDFLEEGRLPQIKDQRDDP